MPILVKPFLYLIAFGPLAILFASVFGLACWLLMVCVRAISLANCTWPQVSVGVGTLSPTDATRCRGTNGRQAVTVSLTDQRPLDRSR
jgi:hypothetical protein